MNRPLATFCLTLALSLPLGGIAARADEASDKLAVAKVLVDKTVLKTLDTGFSVSLDKTVAKMAEAKAEAVRKEARAEFAKQRDILMEGLSKTYAEKFSLSELKQLQTTYDNPVYQKFQAINADPKSEINLISQASVTKLLNMLSLAAASEQGDRVTGPNGAPGMRPMQMPPAGK